MPSRDDLLADLMERALGAKRKFKKEKPFHQEKREEERKHGDFMDFVRQPLLTLTDKSSNRHAL